MTQRFKENDATELQVINLALPSLEALGDARDQFESGAYTCFKLGEVLFDLGRDPVAGVVSRDIFTTTFFAIHALFTRPGTFEFYMELFRAVFGEDVSVVFTIPGPGQLTIDIEAANLVTFKILAREIVDGVYVYHNLLTSDTGEYIVGQELEAIRSEEELRALINEVSPNGIYTVVNLAEV